ncbi:MAG: cell division protein FtsK [Planctomycetota bacterium]|nr:MAG: cell division protein FtsK [Planctomycetota bacterium]
MSFEQYNGIPPREAADSDPSDPRAAEARFVADLEEKIAERASSEQSIAAQYRAACNAADRGFREQREKLAAEVEQERADAAEDYTEQQRHAAARFEYETSRVECEFVELQQRVSEEFKQGCTRAEAEWKDARWEAEAMFEATKDVAPRELEAFEKNVETWLERLEAERDEAHRLVASWRTAWAEDDSAETPPPDMSGDLLAQLRDKVNFVGEQRMALAGLQVAPPAAQFAPAWLFGLVAIGCLVGGLLAGWTVLAVIVATLAAVTAGASLSIALLRYAGHQVAKLYEPLCLAARDAEAIAERAVADARERTARRQAEVEQRRKGALAAADATYETRKAELTARRDEQLQGPAVEYPPRLGAIAARRDRDLELAEATRRRHDAEIARRESDLEDCDARIARQMEEIRARHDAQWSRLADRWQTNLAEMQARAAALRGQSQENPRPWLDAWPEGDWTPALDVPPAIRIGSMAVELDKLSQGMPADDRLNPGDYGRFELPALLRFPERLSLVFKAHGEGRDVAVEAMQAMMLRLLLAVPPGKLRFTIIDPVGLGENFAALMHLADYNEALVNTRIWTEARHIEQRLADLSEHMENVIQKYLRNEFESIGQYNLQAGEIAEPYRFLVIAGFPANFSEAAQRRLMSIAATGARCGVYTLLMVDTQLRPAPSVPLTELEQHATTLTWDGQQFHWDDEQFAPFPLVLDTPPPAGQLTEILRQAGEYANQAGKVEVPFEAIAPADDNLWASSARFGVDVPLGRAGATRLQSLKLGQGTSQHVLVAGKTGSGKSTLLHALVTNLALRFSPDEIELYLVDFKQGVEFKTYAAHHLPHARVVAIESDREFGISVLERLDEELKTRADAFRAAGVQDLAGFRAAQPDRPMPRVLLVVDEFQEFFVEDDRLSQDAGLLLDRLVRQGRAFGIHVLLGSQTLAGAYTLARSTIGQMAVRIALQCSEADAHLILSEDNTAARLLSRAGEAIYNDSNGLIEGNHPFQVVWLGDEKRDKYLDRVQALSCSNGRRWPQVVFEGNAPADLADNRLLAELLESPPAAEMPAAPRIWLGDAVSIKDPTSITFRRQSGSHLLAIGQNEDAALGIFTAALASLAAHRWGEPAKCPRFYIFDGSGADTPPAGTIGQLVEAFAPAARRVSPREMRDAVDELVTEVQRRLDDPSASAPPIFVVAYGLQRLRDLRRGEDDFGFSRSLEDRPKDPSKQFGDVLRDGPGVGVHVLVWCDSVTNLQRTWDRQALREFEMRVVFQMNANDSSTLIDTPLAARLGRHRALFHSDELGILEKFRPYRVPPADWLAGAARSIASPPSHGSTSQVSA